MRQSVVNPPTKKRTKTSLKESIFRTLFQSFGFLPFFLHFVCSSFHLLWSFSIRKKEVFSFSRGKKPFLFRARSLPVLKTLFICIFIGWDLLVCILFHVSIFLKKTEKAETDNTNISTKRNGITFSRDFYPGEEATRLRIELITCKKKKKWDRSGMAT